MDTVKLKSRVQMQRMLCCVIVISAECLTVSYLIISISRLLTEMIQPHKMLQPGLYHFSKFSQGPKITSTPKQQAVYRMMPTFPNMGYGYLLSFKGVVYKFLLVLVKEKKTKQKR